MTRAWLDGLGRVLKAPALLAGVYLVALTTAVPLGLVVRNGIATHLGESVAADTAATGVNWEWWEEFQAQATGVERTFEPRIIGFAVVLGNLSDFLDQETPESSVVVAVGVYLAAWTFLVGGVIDRLARQRRIGSHGFFAACGTHFFRFCRLGVVAGVTYWALFGPIHSWLFDDVFVFLTHDLTVERTAFVILLSLYAVFLLLLLAVNMVFDYAKVRAVVEDRRSMVGAVLAAVRFIRRRPVDTIGLYLLNTSGFIIVLMLYATVAPGVAGTGAAMWGGFLTAQVYVVARLFVKLLFYASHTAYFQSQLAHAEYVAAPRAAWPDSPEAEAIGGTVS